MTVSVFFAAGAVAVVSLQVQPEWLPPAKSIRVFPASQVVQLQPPRVTEPSPQQSDMDCGIRVFRAQRNPDPGIAIPIPAGNFKIRTLGSGCGPQFLKVSTGPAQDSPQQKDVYKAGDAGLKAPRILKETKPRYTPQAMRDKAQGAVMMSAVVNARGDVETVTVTQPLHPELDEEAVAALKKWKFAPGTVDGKPVAVEVDIEMTFTLRDKR